MKHTVVIPTYNRPALMLRLVRYYVQRAPWISLLVLDSSRPAVAEENARALEKLGASVRHMTFADTTEPAAKISAGLATVDTPYASLCADDDLVFPDGLREAIEFLEAHPDYVAAHGLCLNFRQDGADVHLGREPAGPDNDASQPGARIFRQLQQYESLYYAVFRTADLRDLFAAMVRLKSLAFQELLQALGAAIRGKVRRFALFHTLRQSVSPAHPERQNWQSFDWLARDPEEFIAHYRVYRDEVCAFYEAQANAPRMDRRALARQLDLAHAVYLSAGGAAEHFCTSLQVSRPDDAQVVKPGAPSFLNWRSTDPLDTLRTPAWLASSRAARALAALWYFAWAVPGHAWLAWRVRGAWKCRLSKRVLWLAAKGEFRDSFVELCRYLEVR
jgi:glycosyltransferase domain-containing protein